MTDEIVRSHIRSIFWELLETMPIDKISMKILADRSKISRTTLYKYYAQKDDVINELFAEEYKTIAVMKEKMPDTVEIYKKFVSKIYNNKRAILHIYNSAYRDVFFNQIQAMNEIIIMAIVSDSLNNSEATAECIDYITYFLGFAVTGIIRQWIADGIRHFSQDIMRLIKRTVDAAIKPIAVEFMNKPENGHIQEINEIRYSMTKLYCKTVTNNEKIPFKK